MVESFQLIEMVYKSAATQWTNLLLVFFPNRVDAQRYVGWCLCYVLYDDTLSVGEEGEMYTRRVVSM